MVAPNVNPPVVEVPETVDSYFWRSMQYLKTGNLPEILTGLEVYKNHFLPRKMIPAIQSYYQQWLETMKIALFRDIPMSHKLLVLDCLTHYFPTQDALPIVVDFLGNLSPEECTEAKKQLQDVPGLATL